MSASPVRDGVLFLVATPIGNLEDLSTRATATLAAADLIAAEDTRRSGQLLRRLGIEKPLLSLHEHNERARIDAVLARLEAGASVALVSDAGTPLVSDPGYEVVRAAIARGFEVVAVPGPCAAIVALTVSGLPADRFAFEGFLPGRSAARRSRLESLRDERRSLVFYEAPHRLREALRDLAEVFGADRPAAVARELTKVFESVYRGTLGSLAGTVEEDTDMMRGEIVLVVGGAGDAATAVSNDAARIVNLLAGELPPARAAKLAARITGAPRAELYEIAQRAAAGKSERESDDS